MGKPQVRLRMPPEELERLVGAGPIVFSVRRRQRDFRPVPVPQQDVAEGTPRASRPGRCDSGERHGEQGGFSDE